MKLTKDGYKPRLESKRMELYLDSFDAVCVEGPKACGKTWFSLNHSNSAFFLAQWDGNFQNRRLVETDLNYAFVGECPHLIDEWQEIPAIWDAVKWKSDESIGMGKFILTGSSTPSKKGIMHSGTGRIGSMKLRTMSLFESGDSSGKVSLTDIFDNRKITNLDDDVTLEHLIYLTSRGGWPKIIGSKPENATEYVRGYVDSILNDASTLDGTQRNLEKIKMIFKSLARNEGTLAPISRIIADAADGANDGSKEFNKELTSTEKTVREYIDIFDRMFLIENQNAFSPTLTSDVRIGKTPKRHLTDPSLAIASLNLSNEQLLSNLDVYGHFFESMCIRDLDIYAKYLGGKIFHYRDLQNREIDAVIELPDGRYGLFEIKLGSYEIDDAAKKMINIVEMWKKNGLKKEPTVMCVICGVYSASYRREDGVYVVPITTLKP